jgi:hypothetical protein
VREKKRDRERIREIERGTERDREIALSLSYWNAGMKEDIN